MITSLPNDSLPSPAIPRARRPRPRPAAFARASAVVLAAVATLAASGCASPPTGGTADAPAAVDFPRSRLVALDFVDAMVQLPELDPARTTLYTPRPPSRFGELLVASLQDAGYDLRLGAEGADATLDYVVRPEADETSGATGAAAGADGALYTFFVRAAQVRLKRSYRVDVAGVRPASAMRLHGADATAIETSSARFDAPPLAQPTREARRGGGRVAPVARARVDAAPSRTVPTAVPHAPRVATLVTDGGTRSGVRRAASGASASATVGITKTAPPAELAARGPSTPAAAPAPASVAAAPAAPLKRNMYETRRSNYAAIFDDYETLRRDVMVFPNDSLHMGGDNKRLARRIADGFDPTRDVLSVIGCSHGATALVNGNETLANGRSYRVKEEFMLAGIDADLVLEEGCWAGTHFEMMPARGVVVTHKRRAAG